MVYPRPIFLSHQRSMTRKRTAFSHQELGLLKAIQEDATSDFQIDLGMGTFWFDRKGKDTRWCCGGVIRCVEEVGIVPD